VSGGDAARGAAALVLTATTIAMALVALVAGAGFLVVAQRRQRQLGLLGALGAPEGAQRLVLVANGVFVGAAAAITGAVVGLGLWLLLAPAVEAAARHRIHRLDLPWGLLAGCLALGFAACVLAAWWPARIAARQPVMAALARRPVRRAAVHRSTALSLVLVAGGAASVAFAYPGGGRARPLPLIGGLAVLIVGIVLAAPLAVRTVAVVAARLPVAPRLALRDLARHQSRAAAAVAAITLGLGACVAVAVAAQAAEHGPDEGNLSPRQLVLRHAAGPLDGLDTSDATRDRLDGAASDVAAALGDGTTRVPLDAAVNLAAKDPSGVHPINVVVAVDHGYRLVDAAYVGTPEVLAAVGITPAEVRPETDLLTSRPDDVLLLDESSKDRATPTTVVQRVTLPAFEDAPTSFITPDAVQRHRWSTARVAWFLQADHDLGADEVTSARRLAADAGLTIEVRSTQDELAGLRTGATAVGSLLALAIVAMTVGLIRSESLGDVRTLTATGASPGVRRSITASTASALALLGAVLGAVGAYVAIVATYHSDLGRLSAPPWPALAVIVLGVPVVAGLAGWLLAGREPRTFARPVLD
jgi:putative ABC transport system permease protein